MIRIVHHTGKFDLPESYKELNGRQLLRLAPIIYDGGEEFLCNVKALKILSGVSAFKWHLLKAETIDRCLPMVAWVFKEVSVTRQLLPRIKGYYGPTGSFDNLRMKEFHLSEMYYRELVSEKPDQDSLNNLVAVLYRQGKKGYDKKRDPDGDIREDFNHNEIPFHARKIKRWPMAIKQAIFIWYDSCRQELIDNNPLVFKEPSKHSYDSMFDTGLYGMIRSLAGEKLGPVEKVEDMYVHTAMLEIGLIKEEEKYFDQQLKSKT